jgi:F-type H+-transporting ATPase subunit delta
LIGSKIAKRYAKALLSLGQEDGNYETYGQSLQEFNAFCSEHEDFLQVISNRAFSLEARLEILEFVLNKSNFSEIMKRFLRILLEKNRIDAIERITEHYMELIDEISNITRANVVTAMPLKKSALDRLEKVLMKLTSKNVKIEVSQDESLIGGIVVRMGDLVLDGSIKAQLEGLRESLKRGVYI